MTPETIPRGSGGRGVSARVLVCVEVGRVSGLDPETGADDFILMPVSPEELTARLLRMTRMEPFRARQAGRLRRRTGNRPTCRPIWLTP